MEHLTNLVNLNGTSGDEKRVRDYIIENIKDYVDDISVDNLGNIIIFKKGETTPKERLLISAHMDEVGFIITGIEEDGTVKFDTVGGINDESIIGKRVHHESGITGVILSTPIHLVDQKQRKVMVKKTEMSVDFGATTAEETKKHISIGDNIYFEPKFFYSEGRIIGKALDDRVGCSILMDMIKTKHKYDTHYSFVVCEEIGTVGAKIVANAVKPDIVIVVETTTACDIPPAEGSDRVCVLGSGPVVPFMDKGAIYSKKLYKMAFKLGGEYNIHMQTKTAIAGGNDARAFLGSGIDCSVISVSIPCRYLHTAAGIITESDYIDTAKLIVLLKDEVLSD